MEGGYAKLVVIATLAMVVATTHADMFSGFNFCNLNQEALKACSDSQNNTPSPQCCTAVKGVDPSCICFLINSPFLAKNKDQGKNMLTGCGIAVPAC